MTPVSQTYRAIARSAAIPLPGEAEAGSAGKQPAQEYPGLRCAKGERPDFAYRQTSEEVQSPFYGRNHRSHHSLCPNGAQLESPGPQPWERMALLPIKAQRAATRSFRTLGERMSSASASADVRSRVAARWALGSPLGMRVPRAARPGLSSQAPLGPRAGILRRMATALLRKSGGSVFSQGRVSPWPRLSGRGLFQDWHMGHRSHASVNPDAVRQSEIPPKECDEPQIHGTATRKATSGL